MMAWYNETTVKYREWPVIKCDDGGETTAVHHIMVAEMYGWRYFWR